MTRAEKVAQARELRGGGLLLREIAERMGGVSVKTVSEWLNDPDLAKRRSRRQRYSRPCVDCGKPTNGSGGFASQRRRCSECARTWQHESAYWTPERIVAQIQAWAAAHGRAPTATDWATKGEDSHPPTSTVQRVFGSWNAALDAAGFVPNQVGCYGRPGESPLLCAEIARRYEAGESTLALAREYGCTTNAVLYRARKAGAAIRSNAESNALRRSREKLTAPTPSKARSSTAPSPQSTESPR